MNLFDELCKDAKADLDIGKYLQDPQENEGADKDVLNSVEQMEKKMQETLDNAVKKINNAVDAATTPNVPNEPIETNENNIETQEE